MYIFSFFFFIFNNFNLILPQSLVAQLPEHAVPALLRERDGVFLVRVLLQRVDLFDGVGQAHVELEEAERLARVVVEGDLHAVAADDAEGGDFERRRGAGDSVCPDDAAREVAGELEMIITSRRCECDAVGEKTSTKKIIIIIIKTRI